jgi:hypothetical protein
MNNYMVHNKRTTHSSREISLEDVNLKRSGRGVIVPTGSLNWVGELSEKRGAYSLRRISVRRSPHVGVYKQINLIYFEPNRYILDYLVRFFGLKILIHLVHFGLFGSFGFCSLVRFIFF